MSSKLLTILQSKNIIIPENLINDLRSSKAMIEILKLDKLNKDILIEVENYLINIEMKIMILTENELGKGSYDKLLNEIKINNKKQIQDKTYSFSYGVPRNESWIRIKYSKELKIKTIREITEELKLKYKMVGNKYITVYGPKGNLKQFIKKLSKAKN